MEHGRGWMAQMPNEARIINARIFPSSTSTGGNQDTKAPNGLQIIESCLTCPLSKDGRFCDLSQNLLATFDDLSSPATYARNAVLFVEGQKPRGAFVICNGRVKLSTSSADGKSIIVRVARAGQMVGLPGTISGDPYELTAEALEPLQAKFIPRDTFLHFLRQYSEAAVQAAKMLNQIYQATLAEVRYLGLSVRTAEKLARFLLDLPTFQSQNNMRATLTLTHNEIAEIIGTSRETVTRLLARFKHKRYIEVHGSTLVFTNRPGLKDLLAGRDQPQRSVNSIEPSRNGAKFALRAE
jgi:CRP/FNR family transcriptional regulator, cyclic AMP receptor protein